MDSSQDHGQVPDADTAHSPASPGVAAPCNLIPVVSSLSHAEELLWHEQPSPTRSNSPDSEGEGA